MVRLPVGVVGGRDVVAGVGEHGVYLELGLAQVRLRLVLRVVDSGDRGVLLGGRDAEFPCGVDQGPARRSLAAFSAARRASLSSAMSTPPFRDVRACLEHSRWVQPCLTAAVIASARARRRGRVLAFGPLAGRAAGRRAKARYAFGCQTSGPFGS